MLTFLAIAEFQGYRVEQYKDKAVGYLEKAEGGGMAITRIELSPKIMFSGSKTPDDAELERIHADCIAFTRAGQKRRTVFKPASIR